MNGQTTATLSDLVYADKVLMSIYTEVLGKVSAETATILADAEEDHRRHQAHLRAACEQAEVDLSEAGEDVVELMNEHLRMVKANRTEQSLLGVLALAERANAMLYEIAEREDLPEELEELVAEHHADERMHVSLLADRAPHVSQIADEHNVACFTGGGTDDINPDDFD